MIILNDKQIRQKVKRLAFEIIEQNIDEKDIYVVGINRNGTEFAKLLINEIKLNSDKINCHLLKIKLNPAKPLDSKITIDSDLKKLKNKTVIIVDDVANTGRTLFFACRVFMDVLLKKLKVAVLIDRKHKSFPINVDYVGLSLATTIKDNILFQINSESDSVVLLE